MIKVRRKKNNKLIPVLCVILGVLLIICIGIFVTKDNDKQVVEKKQAVEEKQERTVEDEEKQTEDDKQEEIASYEIETDYCKLYFPENWKDQIEIKYTEEVGYKAEFYGLVEGKEAQHLFDVCFNSDDGFLLGYLKNEDEIINISINMNELEFDGTWTQEEIDQIYAMQEDMNFLMESLSKIENYVEP